MTDKEKTVIAVAPLSMPWVTLDPFLFCVHHLDAYPEGNEDMGPAEPLTGRNIGMDFANKDGWNMYHGDVVPGFPRHPHRGFETITIARNGFIDHSDSTGATARFGNGDVQWMTAGNGVVHSEMFPLVKQDDPNPGELFQIWLNLPAKDKKADPYFTMLWDQQIPTVNVTDDAGRTSSLRVIAGEFGEQKPLNPPPSSWASRDESNVAIWTIKMEAGAKLALPATEDGTNRVIYVFQGKGADIAGTTVTPGHAAQVEPTHEIEIVAGDAESELLVLQGRPIGEPVVQHGPFVMNYPGEIRQAMIDYQETQFGGWPFDSDQPVHEREQGRFAIHSDGRREDPDAQIQAAE